MNPAEEPGSNSRRAGCVGRVGGAVAILFLGWYLYWLLASVDRYPCEYTFKQFLFDYRYGIVRRALEGEVVRHVFPPPYSAHLFIHFNLVVMALALSLFFAMAAIAVVRRRSSALLIVIFAAATSPLVFKNYLYDQGRQDVFGLLLTEILVICGLMGWDVAATIIFGASVVPLCLVADNHLFLFIPTCLALVAFRWDGERIELRRYSWVPFFACAVALALSLTLPRPSIPLGEYTNYLQSKSVDTFSPGIQPEFWLYASVGKNLGYAKLEFRRLAPMYKEHALDFIFAAAVNLVVAFVAASTLRARRAMVVRYAALVSGIALCYIPLYLLAADVSRWTSNLTTCLYMVAISATSRFGSSAAVGATVLVGVVVFQVMVHHGFGIEEPIAYEVSSIAKGILNTMDVRRLW